MQREAGDVLAGEEQTWAEGHALPEQLELVGDRVARGPEVAFLVELAVLGQVGLGDRPEHTSAVNDDRCIEQPGLRTQRRANHEQGRQVGTRRDHALQRLEHRFGYGLLME